MHQTEWTTGHPLAHCILADQLLRVSLALHQLSTVCPHLPVPLLNGIRGCGGGLQSGREMYDPVGPNSTCCLLIHPPLPIVQPPPYLVEMGDPACPRQSSGWQHCPWGGGGVLEENHQPAYQAWVFSHCTARGGWAEGAGTDDSLQGTECWPMITREVRVPHSPTRHHTHSV